jgi:ABC-2 type transport system ATP-binding protein
MYALEVQDLRKTYKNGVEALKGVSLQVAEGDFFALLGPNGAGKSTLIGIVSSLVNATAGDALVFGTSVRRQRAEAMSYIGLVPWSTRPVTMALRGRPPWNGRKST